MNDQDIQKLPVVSLGANNAYVSDIKAILRSQGHWDGTTSSIFGPKLKGAVQYFQSTHLGPDGRYLQGDGEVGPRTWWALYNPSGSAQKSNIISPAVEAVKEDIPQFESRYKGLSSNRRTLLKVLFTEHSLGVHEIPDGSNGGDGVEKYLTIIGKAPWCAALQSWAIKETTGDYARGRFEAHVQTWINRAKKGGYLLSKNSKPSPGDLAVWAFSGGTGHVSCVVAVGESGSAFNTIVGNEGNRVKLGLRRKENEPKLVGFIDVFGDSKDQTYSPGILPNNWSKDSALDQNGTR